MNNYKGEYVLTRNIPYEENHRNTNNILEKKCSYHEKYFPNENPWMECNENYFYKSKMNRTDGLYTYCKRCAVRDSQEYDATHEGHRKQYNQKYYPNNKEKNKLQKRKDIKNNRKHYDNYRLEWQRNNKDKLSSYGQIRKRKKHKVTEQEWEQCKKYFNHRCCYCGLPIEEHITTYRGKQKLGDFHKDHLIDDGKNDLANCVPACKQCNTSKHTAALNEWYNIYNPNYTYERYHKIYLWIRYDYKKYIKKKRIKVHKS